MRVGRAWELVQIGKGECMTERAKLAQSREFSLHELELRQDMRSLTLGDEIWVIIPANNFGRRRIA